MVEGEGAEILFFKTDLINYFIIVERIVTNRSRESHDITFADVIVLNCAFKGRCLLISASVHFPHLKRDADTCSVIRRRRRRGGKVRKNAKRHTGEAARAETGGADSRTRGSRGYRDSCNKRRTMATDKVGKIIKDIYYDEFKWWVYVREEFRVIRRGVHGIDGGWCNIT